MTMSEERREAERLAKSRWPGDASDIETDVIHARARSTFEQGYAAGRESMRAELEDLRQGLSDRLLEKHLKIGNLEGLVGNRNRELTAERERSAKLINDLRFARTWLDAQEFAEEFSRIMDEYEASRDR